MIEFDEKLIVSKDQLDNKNYFFENENDNEFDQYKYDYLESLIISRSGINNWSISYNQFCKVFVRI